MADISGAGTQLTLVASATFPAGFQITAFADDADPLDVPALQIADKAMGLNGDLVTWSKANPLVVNLNVIPGSDDDANLAILLEANRVGKGKASARDELTLTVIYPDGRVDTFVAGKITDGSPTDSVASSGRKKSKQYSFAFENKISA